MGLLLGRIFWIVTPRWRKNLAIKQIKECLNFDISLAEITARKSVYKYGYMIVEFLCFPNLNKDNIQDKVVFKEEDKNRLKELFLRGKGVVLSTAHFGNWEILGASLPLYGFPLVSVAQKQHNDAMDKFINEYRSMHGQHVTYRTGVLEMVHMLDKGYAIGLLTDQDGGKDGTIINFFGKESSCPKGSAALARLKKAPLALILIHAKGDGMYEISLSEEIYVARTKNREEDIKNATIKVMALLEDEIKAEPEMWFWLHNRWKMDKDIFK